MCIAFLASSDGLRYDSKDGDRRLYFFQGHFKFIQYKDNNKYSASLLVAIATFLSFMPGLAN